MTHDSVHSREIVKTGQCLPSLWNVTEEDCSTDKKGV